ncbi:hypothetical protein CFT12S00416_05560 [Campylobacter fetus subsp. testudinum]|uniref:hypothetical protein n=1 Tax=Campylobacter fetus TaxID=196 RepID=UPI0008188C44|nr:hypothetical protein [Campylobacter fetus]OCR88891.1 hypothetical protein CFT12S00416_05560 [Campylobacter fetus subsp. testudinum]
MKTKQDYEKLGEIISKSTNGLSIFTKEIKGKNAKASYVEEKISGGKIGDIVLFDKLEKRYVLLNSKVWATLPANTEEAIETRKANDPVSANLQNQIEKLKGELNTLKNPENIEDEGLLKGVKNA